MEKPVAVMSASTALNGGTLAKAELRKVLRSCGALLLAGPEVAVGVAYRNFDQCGNLIDEPSLEDVRKLLLSLASLLSKRSAATVGRRAFLMNRLDK
jgi:NAD(P)H-dependent FMN reductase